MIATPAYAGGPDGVPFLRAYFFPSELDSVSPDVSIDTLRELHLQHDQRHPFENLDVLLPREIHLDDGRAGREADRRPPRGYCFEQNGLLERALREIGLLTSAACWAAWCWPTRRRCRRVLTRLLLVGWRGGAGSPTVSGLAAQTLTALPIKLLAEYPTANAARRAIVYGCMKDEWTLRSSTITNTGSRCTPFRFRPPVCV